MPDHSSAAWARQKDWSNTLWHTVSEVEAVTATALRSHVAYTTAMSRLGELYCFCGTLMEHGLSQGLVPPHADTDMTAVKDAAVHAHRSIQQWRDSADVLALHTFLRSQHQMWKQEEQEVFQARLMHRVQDETRQRVQKAEEQMEREKHSPSPALKALKRDLDALIEEGQKGDDKLRKRVMSVARHITPALRESSTKLVDLMSAYGQVCAISFQPFGGVMVMSSLREGRGQPDSPYLSDPVNGIVMQRPPFPQWADDAAGVAEEEAVGYGEGSPYLTHTSLATSPSPSLSSASSDGQLSHQDWNIPVLA